MDPEMKVTQQRLSVLEFAKALGNVSEACRRRGMTRTMFYEYKRRFELYGIEGVKDLPPIHKTHPQTTPPEIQEKIIALSLETSRVRGCHHSQRCAAVLPRAEPEG